jgi:enamine deaminase RidA (YjgF/YER057c/UK114 family)
VSVVDNLEKAIEKAEKAAAKLEAPPQSFAWGSLANLSDPFGHGLCLLQWSGRGYDEVAYSAAQPLPFSEAVRVGNTTYLSGQIRIVPGTLGPYGKRKPWGGSQRR